MVWAKPEFSRSRVNEAGRILRDGDNDINRLLGALDVLNNWRSCHGYPINTFQATLRSKLKRIDQRAIVAQRLKRTPSIVAKLRLFGTMRLSQMQDIGGLRAVVQDLELARSLEMNYTKSRFKHELVALDDYIETPKPTGYRSIHLVYRYQNPKVDFYDNLLVELQIRSRIQHAWATAVEIMGTFLEHPLKSSAGPAKWLDFFALTGSAFAHLEGCPPVPGYGNLSIGETFKRTEAEARRLEVRENLAAFALASDHISEDNRRGNYHLIVLDTQQKQLQIESFGKNRLGEANQQYALAEKRVANGERLQVVLVSAGPISELRQAYPNYYLDTGHFIHFLDKIADVVRPTK